ncbi:hypothetical protein AB5I41_00010 [Sphingomonas sp. MMS24-JH45]
MTGEVVYLSAMEEQKHTVAQASAELRDDDARSPKSWCRRVRRASS